MRTENNWTVLTHSAAPGGAELGLLRYLRRTELVKTVVVFEHGPLVDQLRGLGLCVVVPTHPQKYLRRLFRERTPRDFFLSNTLRAALVARLAGVPGDKHVIYVQDAVRGGYFSTIKRVAIERFILPSAASHVANSEYTKSSLPARAKARTTVVGTPSGVSRRDVARHQKPLHHPIRLLSLSRLSEWKGIHVLLAALEQLESHEEAAGLYTLTIAGGSHFGEEAYVRRLKETASRLKTDVRFLGHVDNPTDLLARSDVLIHSSITPEPFGQVIVQGAAAGLMTIVADAGGAAEIARAIPAIGAVPPGDPGALAAALLELTGPATVPSEVVIPDGFTDEAVATALDEALAMFGSQ